MVEGVDVNDGAIGRGGAARGMRRKVCAVDGWEEVEECMRRYWIEG
jgi:hypothetical protein